MIFKIKILKLAELEIDNTVDFYESRSKGLGKRFFIYLKSYYKILKTNPEIFEVKKPPFYRELPMSKFPFVIIYEIFENEVLIHSVFHTSRNPNAKP